MVIITEVSLTNVTYFIDGEDYSGGQMTVNVPAGVMTQTFALAIVDNNIVECDETFIVRISAITTYRVTVVDHNIKVRITDDDSK